MSRLRPEKLHVTFLEGTGSEGPVIPRCYTLTHSDRTGDLYLGIGAEYNQDQLTGWQVRLMRDEVLAEWRQDEAGTALHLHCHVSGGWALGSAAMRYAIFRRELPLVLEAFRYGDRRFFAAHPDLDAVPVWIHFHASRPRYDRVERWGTPARYRVVGKTR